MIRTMSLMLMATVMAAGSCRGEENVARPLVERSWFREFRLVPDFVLQPAVRERAEAVNRFVPASNALATAATKEWKIGRLRFGFETMSAIPPRYGMANGFAARDLTTAARLEIRFR